MSCACWFGAQLKGLLLLLLLLPSACARPAWHQLSQSVPTMPPPCTHTSSPLTFSLHRRCACLHCRRRCTHACARSKERLDRIQELRWTHRALPDHAKANLSPLELQYFRSYDKLLNKYMRSGRGGVGLDLTADPTPPDDPYVQARALRLRACWAWCGFP